MIVNESSIGAPGTTPERAIITAQDQWEGSVRLDLPLIDPARWARVAAAGHPVEAASARVDEATDTEARTVVSWFFELLGQEALVSAARQDVETAKETGRSGFAGMLDYLKRNRTKGRICSASVESGGLG